MAIKIDHVETYGWEAAIRGMRNPMNSWKLSDSKVKAVCDAEETDIVMGDINDNFYQLCIGKNDQDLMMRLRKAGKDHRKFMRMIGISMDIAAPTFWWAEFDTYKVGTVRNSCSKMHTIHIKEITAEDFAHEGIDEVGGLAANGFFTAVNACEWLREKFNETQEKRFWRALIELLPEGYILKATVTFDYEVAANMHQGRRHHKLLEWHTFCDVLECLPCSQLITGKTE